MSIRRAALYIGGASLLGAWLSSAASLTVQLHEPPAPQPVEDAADPAGGLAADVQAHGRRLKERLASAPPAPQPLRNPFEFRTAVRLPAPESSRGVNPAAVDLSASVSQEPNFSLVGVAAHQHATGPVRTAIIATEHDELIMAVVGDLVLQRYRVTAIGADSAEFTDAETGRARRLSLHPQ